MVVLDENDAIAYARARELFDAARRTRRALPSLIEQVADSTNMLRSPGFEVSVARVAGDGQVAAAAARHSSLMDALRAKRREYERLLLDCEAVLSDMEGEGDGTVGDVAVLRYFYMQGMTDGQAHRRLKADGIHYSRSYMQEKREVALLHAARAMQRIGLA